MEALDRLAMGAAPAALLNFGVARVPRTVPRRAAIARDKRRGRVFEFATSGETSSSGRLPPAGRGLAAALLRDLCGASYADIAAELLTSRRYGATDDSDARRLVSVGRREASDLGAWPWAHFSSGRLLSDWRERAQVPLRAWLSQKHAFAWPALFDPPPKQLHEREAATLTASEIRERLLAEGGALDAWIGRNLFAAPSVADQVVALIWGPLPRDEVTSSRASADAAALGGIAQTLELE